MLPRPIEGQLTRPLQRRRQKRARRRNGSNKLVVDASPRTRTTLASPPRRNPGSRRRARPHPARDRRGRHRQDRTRREVQKVDRALLPQFRNRALRPIVVSSDPEHRTSNMRRKTMLATIARCLAFAGARTTDHRRESSRRGDHLWRRPARELRRGFRSTVLCFPHRRAGIVSVPHHARRASPDREHQPWTDHGFRIVELRPTSSTLAILHPESRRKGFRIVSASSITCPSCKSSVAKVSQPAEPRRRRTRVLALANRSRPAG